MAHKDNTKNAEAAAKTVGGEEVPEAVEETFEPKVKSVNVVGNHTGVIQLNPVVEPKA